MTTDSIIHPTTAVIIPAAGKGSRFGSETPKQFLPLRGKPIVFHVIERFLAEHHVARVIVCVAPEWRQFVEDAATSGQWDRVTVTEGGSTRQESVHRGVLIASGLERINIVAIHDSVRPFFRLSTLRAAIHGAEHVGAALPGIPLTDTIHRTHDRMIVETPDRENWVAAQTPQCFRLSLLREVLDRARNEGITGTDEAGLAARFGHPVRVIEGDPMNLKITRPEDLAFASYIFEKWGAMVE
jgi:2-C-methyl-D-erythritol 4-phosphate cytidylyltransferase